MAKSSAVSRILRKRTNKNPHPDGNSNTETALSERSGKKHYFGNYFHHRLFLIAMVSPAAIGCFLISSEYAGFEKKSSNVGIQCLFWYYLNRREYGLRKEN